MMAPSGNAHNTSTSNQSSEQQAVTGSDSGKSPLTKVEKDWLKKHFNGEFHFLLCYELSIYKEEDREEGRQIMRALMQDDDEA